MSVTALKEKPSVLYSWLCESIDTKLGLSKEESMHVLVPVWYDAATDTYVYPDRGINMYKNSVSEALDRVIRSDSDFIGIRLEYVIPRQVYVQTNDNGLIICRCIGMWSIHRVLTRLKDLVENYGPYNNYINYVKVLGQGSRICT